MAIDTIKSSAVLDGAIATADIADDAVTGAKIENNPTVAGNLATGGTLAIAGHGSVGNAGTVAGTRALTVVGATDGTSSQILVGYNSSLSSKFSIRDDGYTSIGAGLDVQGNISVPSSSGIDFSANAAAAGMTSELLDDYEEGTWTPVVGGNASYNNQQGLYTKVGRLVFIRGDINVNVLGTGSANTLTGLPFSGNYQSTPQGMVDVGYYSNISQNFTWLSGYVLNNSAGIYFSGNTGGAVTIQVNGGNVFGNNARILFSAVYNAD